MVRSFERALVTGAGGFIGANLVRRLAQDGVSACALVRPGGNCARLPAAAPLVQMMEADVRDYDAVSTAFHAFRPQVIFHAAMSAGHPADEAQCEEAMSTSVTGTKHVLAAAFETRARRVIYLGSYLTGSETARGAAKSAAALACREFALAHSYSAVELRLFSVYGPWEQSHRLIPTLLKAGLARRPIRVRKGPSHDFIYVGDVVEGCLRAASAPALESGCVLHLGTGRSYRNEEVVKFAESLFEYPYVIEPEDYPPQPADSFGYAADLAPTRAALGWVPSTDLVTGLALTRDWLQSDGSTTWTT